MTSPMPLDICPQENYGSGLKFDAAGWLLLKEADHVVNQKKVDFDTMQIPVHALQEIHSNKAKINSKLVKRNV